VIATMFTRRYGASPLHLLGHIAAFTICAYALAQIVSGGAAVNFAVWFAGAALLHDLVFLPLYSLLDRVAYGGRAANTGAAPQGRGTATFRSSITSAYRRSSPACCCSSTSR
jgi:hypothetical protein